MFIRLSVEAAQATVKALDYAFNAETPEIEMFTNSQAEAGRELRDRLQGHLKNMGAAGDD